MRGIVGCAVVVLLSAVGCSDSHPRNEHGGETHFLTECPDDACAEGLSCVCGVCTQTCESSATCDGLASGAACQSVEPRSLVCDGPAQSVRICDVTCARDAQCEALGAGFECVEGRCRPEAIASVLAMTSSDASAGDAAVDASSGVGCTDPECGAAVDPLVMLIVDTSGSMERQAQCTCMTASCEECLPDCDADEPDKNRWTQTLEALTGTFDGFTCEPVERRAQDYDAEYVFPHFKPSGTQRDDGILQEFADRVRFGVATLDGIAGYGREQQITIDEFDFGTSTGEAGLWSYPPMEDPSELETHADGWATGQYKYPFCASAYVMNTGIRNRDAESGALVLAPDSESQSTTVEAIHQTLLAARPYGSTPMAAALDDIRALFTNDATTLVERRNPERRRHLILITDGRPDDDYRQVGCDCMEDGDDSDCGGPPNDPLTMGCPYPLPEQVTRVLRCGDHEACDSGVFDSVHVIGLDVSADPEAVDHLDLTARAGGDPAALYADDGAELQDVLRGLLEQIASGAQTGSGVPEPIEQPAARKAACAEGDLLYPSGAKWSRFCNTCECDDGQVTCTDKVCGACTKNTDCGAGVCILSSDCTTGECGRAVAEACDEAVNRTSVCACDGETYSVSDCVALAKGIKHGGRCE